MMKIDIFELEKMREAKLLEKQVHPSHHLTIWNYSQTCQYDNNWNETLLMCRGLVTDNEGNIVARPFKKFFNLEEKKHVHSDTYTIWEKVDGSLGILFCYNGEWIISSRGSFTSDQSRKAGEILGKTEGRPDFLVDGNTYLFEIVYPENQIVLNYGSEEKLVFLGFVNNETGEEFTPDKVEQSEFEIPTKHELGDYNSVSALNWENHEGFVVVFSNGQKMKIKFEWYLKRHKIVWSLTNRLLWEYLSEGKVDELLEALPDEFYAIVKEEIAILQEKWMEIYEICGLDYYRCFDHSTTRKYFAEKALRTEYPQVLFAILDKKDYTSIIWKIIYPKTIVRLLTKN
jgi:RNA ligase